MKYPSSLSTRQPAGSEYPSAQVLSVSRLNKMARSILEDHFPSVLVEGEISNFITPASGHWYLTLKDAKSQIRCAMFRNKNLKVRFKPANGTKVLAKGKLSLYEGRGDYQLILDDLEEAGDGALRRAFEKLKAMLESEGLFDPQNKKLVSNTVTHIGVITSPTGAAIKDILSVLARRFPSTKVTVLPVTVQGADAPGEIASAIELANKLQPKLGFEALIVGRGGGSLEDLQAFNEEVVARAIHSSQLPIVSAVGHEIDFTIADFVADLRAPTPSAAAELLSPDQNEYLQSIFGFTQLLTNAQQRTLNDCAQKLSWLSKRLTHPGRKLQDQSQALDILTRRLELTINNSLQHQHANLAHLLTTIASNSPSNRIAQLKIRNDNNKNRLQLSLKQSLKKNTEQLAHLVRGLNAISPLQTLSRGYSLTMTAEKSVVRNAQDVEVGDTLVTRLQHGSITSSVIETNSKLKDNDLK